MASALAEAEEARQLADARERWVATLQHEASSMQEQCSMLQAQLHTVLQAKGTAANGAHTSNDGGSFSSQHEGPAGIPAGDAAVIRAQEAAEADVQGAACVQLEQQVISLQEQLREAQAQAAAPVMQTQAAFEAKEAAMQCRVHELEAKSLGAGRFGLWRPC